MSNETYIYKRGDREIKVDSHTAGKQHRQLLANGFKLKGEDTPKQLPEKQYKHVTARGGSVRDGSIRQVKGRR